MSEIEFLIQDLSDIRKTLFGSTSSMDIVFDSGKYTVRLTWVTGKMKQHREVDPSLVVALRKCCRFLRSADEDILN